MPKAKERRAAKYQQARQLIEALAKSGNCADYIDVQIAAKGRGLDRAVDDLLVHRSVRDEVNALCKKARQAKRY